MSDLASSPLPLRPDGKLVINRAWGDAAQRLNGALQLAKGLAKAAG